ncbi:MAG TPA: HIT domain-containing protein [Thermodesulfobacteriota bacterium]|nr:HIT domain-containing protein [Thermodesulfobacteriota bacterium]
MKKFKIILLFSISLCVGILIGGYLFSQSQPRSFLAINRCQSCLTHEDLLGLLASVQIQRFLGLMPFKVFETDKTVVIKHPFSSDRIHYVIIPKKDIKNIGQISDADAQYLTDVFFVARWIIEREKLSRYRLYTNGPGLQDVTYLHFHLVAE